MYGCAPVDLRCDGESLELVLDLFEGLGLPRLGVRREVELHDPLHVLEVGVLRQCRVPTDVDLFVLLVVGQIEVEDEGGVAAGQFLKDWREEVSRLFKINVPSIHSSRRIRSSAGSSIALIFARRAFDVESMAEEVLTT